jgi:hypothetical protein
MHRSRFNVPSHANTAASPVVVPLPAEMPDGLLDLPSLPSESSTLAVYLQRPHRWSFTRHLENLPRHGVGQMHPGIYRAAIAGLAEGRPSVEIHYLLRETAINQGRPRAKAEREVYDAIINAHTWFSGAVHPHTTRSRIPETPRINWAELREIAFGEENLDTLRNASGAIPQSAGEVLAAIYDSEDLLCCAEEMHSARTKPLSNWLADGIGCQRLLVPNPMRALTGIKADGKASPRCNDNAGPCRWIVVEFDFSEDNEQDAALLTALAEADRNNLDLGAALHAHLQRFLPLAMVVFSGKKSLHGWFSAAGLTQDDANCFRDYARSLKADPALFVPCQLTRMPWGTRENDNPQSVIYFNQEVIGHAG